MLSTLISVLALVATAASQNVTGPFAVSVIGKTNSSINGFVGACHAGAAVEGLCYSAGGVTNSSYLQFYFNSSSFDYETGVPSKTGFLIWKLPYTDENGSPATVASPLQIVPNWGSNVAVALFYPSASTTYLSYTENGTFYLQGGVDDSSFNATYPVVTTGYGNLTNFNLCYQYTGGYYYYSIAWVFTQPSHNPSCQPVQLRMAPIS